MARLRGCEVARFEVARLQGCEVRGCEVARLRGSRLQGCEVARFKIFHIPSDDIFLDSFVFTNDEVRGCDVRGCEFQFCASEVESYIDDQTTRFLYSETPI